MQTRQYEYHVVASAKATAGIGAAFLAKTYKNLLVEISTTGVGAGEAVTVKCQRANADDMPDFSSAASVTNFWSYQNMIDQDSGVATAGSTGVVVSGADTVSTFLVNTDGATWIDFELSSITGTVAVTINVYGYSD